LVTGLALLDRAAELSATPEAVGPALRRLVEERPGTLGRLVDGDELNSLGRALVSVFEASNILARLCLADPAALDVLDDLTGPMELERSDAQALARSSRLAGLRIAARDLLGLDPLEVVGTSLASLASDVLEAALALSVDSSGEREAQTMAVIGMGKLGGAELNYASDVDVVFVTAGDTDTRRARRVMELAGASFRVDADLRPEGRAGALSRSLDSYRAYWERRASAWEFQALLKARPVAGDAVVGAGFAQAADEALWGRSFSSDQLAELRAMKARSEEMVRRRGMAGWELKRGPGGIRDVEFAVQLLQLVHGKADPAIRARSTLGALAELGEAGYVSTDDAAVLADHYRFLRTVEHRLQLVEYEQTHAVPAEPRSRRRIARLLGFVDDARSSALERFDDELRRRLAEVRAIHERLFFRPLLEAFSGAPSMVDEALERRLAAFGFADARRTAAAVEELAGGLDRSSRLMSQLLPLLLDWLSLTPDPDLGLLGLRALVVNPHHRSLVVSAFRESPEAARRLCLLMGSSRALSEALSRNPELIAAIDDDEALAPDSRATLRAEARARLGRAADDEARRAQLLRLRQDQFVRVAARDLLGLDGVEAVGVALSDIAEALLDAAVDDLIERRAPGSAFCVIGMGRLGGAELAYGSDLDVLFVHGDEDDDAGADRPTGEALAEALLHLMHGRNPATRAATLDLGLRPEGAQGRLSRDVAGYRLYFTRWAHTWERQALLRARVVAGDRPLGERFMAEARQFLWHRPLGSEELAEIRRMKARIESERIPSGEDPQFHLKLGRGSLSDVEWTVQLLQLRQGVAEPSTMTALEELETAGALEPADAQALRASYRFCERTRNRWHLVGALAGGTGPGDALPGRAHDLSRLARSLSTTPAALRDDYRRVTRRARRVTERLFYGIEDGGRR
jgi:[glutamine synthetase] adenylyltransferase / [glutamine synthetase]-adenylyl-L-tyrosine phosphorylase